MPKNREIVNEAELVTQTSTRETWPRGQKLRDLLFCPGGAGRFGASAPRDPLGEESVAFTGIPLRHVAQRPP